MGAVLEFEIELSGQEPGLVAAVRVHVDRNYDGHEQDAEWVELERAGLKWTGEFELAFDVTVGTRLIVFIDNAMAEEVSITIKRQGGSEIVDGDVFTTASSAAERHYTLES